jgi:hypothetical protein
MTRRPAAACRRLFRAKHGAERVADWYVERGRSRCASAWALTARVYPRIVRIALRLASVVAMALPFQPRLRAEDTNTVLVGHIEASSIPSPPDTSIASSIMVKPPPWCWSSTAWAASSIRPADHRRMLNSGVPICAPSAPRRVRRDIHHPRRHRYAWRCRRTSARRTRSTRERHRIDLRTKAENDAVAQITNIARARHKRWAEDARRKSVSIGADEAISLKSSIATDVRDLVDRSTAGT